MRLQILMKRLHHLRIIYHVTVLKTRKKKLSSEGSDLRIFKERMYFCLSNRNVEMYTMKSKLYRKRGKTGSVIQWGKVGCSQK